MVLGRPWSELHARASAHVLCGLCCSGAQQSAIMVDVVARRQHISPMSCRNEVGQGYFPKWVGGSFIQWLGTSARAQFEITKEQCSREY